MKPISLGLIKEICLLIKIENNGNNIFLLNLNNNGTDTREKYWQCY